MNIRFSVAFLLGFLFLIQGTDPSKCVHQENRHLISVRSLNANEQLAIAVDDDKKVTLSRGDAKEDMKSIRTLGYEEPFPQDFHFTSEIPKDQALISLRKQSCGRGGWTVWIALTVGIAKAEGLDAYRSYSFLRIFLDRPQGREVLAVNKFSEINRIIVDDINADGLPEIAVEYSEEGGSYTSWLRIWRIEPDGHIKPLSLDNLEKDLTFSDKVQAKLTYHGDANTYIQMEQRLIIDKTWHFIRNNYAWDEKAQQYRLTSTNRIEEKPF